MNLGLQRRTDLALGALRVLSNGGESMPGAGLAESLDTTTSFLPQIMSPLVKAGWVESGRGPGGGYRLTDLAHTVSVLDVIEVTEGPTADGRCVLREAPCPGEETCQAHAVWTAARDVIIEGFKGIPAIPTQGESA